MKSIGYVLADFPILSETFVGDEIRAMTGRGHRILPIVTNLSDGPAQTADRLLARDARTVSSASAADALRSLARPARSAFAALQYLVKQKGLARHSLMWNAMKIAAIAREHGCGHLHAHFSGGAAAHAIVAARWIGVSVSFVCHGHDVYAEPADLPAKLEAADAVVAVCKDIESDLLALAPRANVTTIHCGADPEVFQPYHAQEFTRKLLFVGRLVEQKGIDDLLSALAIQGTACIDIVGDGPLLDPLRERAQALGVSERVDFLGASQREWIVAHGPSYFGFVAHFKQAPDGSKDTGPLVIKEAMAMGLPVVATRFMGIKEIVSPETGFLAKPADPASLAQAIDQLVALSLPERAAIGLRARARLIAFFPSTRRRWRCRASSRRPDDSRFEGAARVPAFRRERAGEGAVRVERVLGAGRRAPSGFGGMRRSPESAWRPENKIYTLFDTRDNDRGSWTWVGFEFVASPLLIERQACLKSAPRGDVMKTIGYVLADFPIFSETFVGDEIRAMTKRGYEIKPIVMHLSDGPAQEAD